jgi:hypothetical protein
MNADKDLARRIALYTMSIAILISSFAILFATTPFYVNCYEGSSSYTCSTGLLTSSNTNSSNFSSEDSITPIPEEYKNQTSTTEDVVVSFEHNPEGNQVFEEFSHDAMITQENDTRYLILGRDGSQDLYSSDSPSEKSSWNLEDGNYLKPVHEGDDIVKQEDKIIVHTSDSVYTTNNSINTDNWTERETEKYDFADSAIYYDEEKDEYHSYYEKGTKSGLSGVSIGHAVSPNGIDNWTVYPEVWNSSDSEYGVGDFDIVELNDTIIMVGDYDKYHPKYNIAVWTNKDPYTEFNMKDEFAISPRESEKNFSDDFGISDAELVETPQDGFIMYANGHDNNETKSATLHMYNGTVSVEKD